MDHRLFSEAQRRAFLARMNLPVRVAVGLMLALGTLVFFGATDPFPQVWMVELATLLVMVLTVLVFAMEVVTEPPLIRLFSVLGFCWVGILFGMTLIDYLTRGRWPP